MESFSELNTLDNLVNSDCFIFVRFISNFSVEMVHEKSHSM